MNNENSSSLLACVAADEPGEKHEFKVRILPCAMTYIVFSPLALAFCKVAIKTSSLPAIQTICDLLKQLENADFIKTRSLKYQVVMSIDHAKLLLKISEEFGNGNSNEWLSKLNTRIHTELLAVVLGFDAAKGVNQAL